MRYTDRIIKPLGTQFEMFKETEEPQMMAYRVSDIDISHERWQQANGRCNAVLYHQKQALLKATETVINVEDDDTFDLTDIEELFAAEGRGPHMLEYEFESVGEPVAYITQDQINSEKWCWKHKLTGKTFWRFQNKSGQSYDTGRCVKFLESIKKQSHPLAYARAMLILRLNGSKKHQVADERIPEAVPLDRKTVLLQQVRCSLLHICFFILFHHTNIRSTIS